MFRVVTLAFVGLAVIGTGPIAYGQSVIPLPPAQTGQTVTWSIDVPGLRTNWAGSMVQIHVVDGGEVGGVNPQTGPNLFVPNGITTIPASQAVTSQSIAFTLWHNDATISGLDLTAGQAIRELDIRLQLHGSDTAGNDGQADVEAWFFDIFHQGGNPLTVHMDDTVSIYVASNINALSDFNEVFTQGGSIVRVRDTRAALAAPGNGHFLMLPGSVNMQIIGGAQSLFWKSLLGTHLAADIQHSGVIIPEIPEPLSISLLVSGLICAMLGLGARRRRIRS